jgi:hypothetical protein
MKLVFYSIRKYTETIKMQRKISLLEWWRFISEKKCDGCAHLEEDGYNEALKEFLQQMGMSNTLDIQKPNSRR